MRSIEALCLFVCFVVSSAQFLKAKIGNSTVLNLNSFYSTSYTVQCGAYKYFAVNFPYPCKDLIISLKVTSGQPDIYASKADVDKDPYPTKHKLTWSAFSDNLYTLTISRWDPESSPGFYYIGIYNDCTNQQNSAKFKIQALMSQDPAVALGLTDILEYPRLGLGKTVKANGYTFFRFCLPECANVMISLQNCMDNTVCPGAYSFPELLVSRHTLLPSLKDYSYKLASTTRRHVWVNHTDPSGRDSNGFIQGSYYVAVFGYCTAQQYVQNNATDGPCAYAANTVFNVTVQAFPLSTNIDDGTCPEIASSLLTPTPPSYPPIESGQSISGVVPCTQYGAQQYKYYTLKVPRPCNNLNILLTTPGAPLDLNTAELAVGRYPNVMPTFDNIEWTSYDNGNQNMTISAFDPAFDGGYVCGPTGISECLMYIGVTGYCVTPGVTHVNFTLTATLQHLGNNIYGVDQANQIITPSGVKQYQFCVDDAVDVKAQLKSFTSACECPNSYSNLEFVISRTNAAATINDLTWKLESGDTTGIVKLLESDADTRPGTYYLNVLGSCTATASCDDTCTCGPCTNLATSPYSIFVANQTALSKGSNRTLSTGTCPASTVLGGSKGVCAATCPAVVVIAGDSSYYTEVLSQGGKAAIAICVLLVCLTLIGCTLCYYRKNLTCCQKYVPCCQTQQQFSSFRDDKIPLFETGEPVVIQL